MTCHGEPEVEEDAIDAMKELRLEDEEGTLDYAPSVEKVEEILGYVFKDKTLLVEAFTHHSFCSEEFSSYERLEYIGDSVLNLLLAKEHYFSYPKLLPGQLTRLRAANANTEKLARVAIKHGFHRYLRHNVPNLDDKIQEFERGILKYDLHSNGLIVAPKVLADIVESIIGALFIDTNSCLDTVWKVMKVLLEPAIEPNTMKVHPVTQLHEACQKKRLKIRFVDQWQESMIVYVYIDDKLVGQGMSEQRKEIAHNRAAKDALDNITKLLDKKDDQR